MAVFPDIDVFTTAGNALLINEDGVVLATAYPAPTRFKTPNRPGQTKTFDMVISGF
jgi:hypothetical protein